MAAQAASGAARVCAGLLAALKPGGVHGEVLAAFDHAVNLSTELGLVSVLTQERALLPCSIQLPKRQAITGEAPFPLADWERGSPIRLDALGLYAGGGGRLVSLAGASPVDLSIYNRLTAGGNPLPMPGAEPVIDWLLRHGDAAGLAPLVTNGTDNPYTALIRPRLPALLAAVREKDAARAAEAAAQMAGCGPGLTPSSDDLLAGYMAALHALAACGHMAAVLPMTARMAQRAANKTNRISGAFLLHSGNGQASEDVLALLEALFLGTDGLNEAIARVGAYGSTSGADILTGIALAIFSYRRE
jgi:hypothetical protein